MNPATYRSFIAAALATALLTACVMAVAPAHADDQPIAFPAAGQTAPNPGQTTCFQA